MLGGNIKRTTLSSAALHIVPVKSDHPWVGEVVL